MTNQTNIKELAAMKAGCVVTSHCVHLGQKVMLFQHVPSTCGTKQEKDEQNVKDLRFQLSLALDKGLGKPLELVAVVFKISPI